MRRDIYVSRYDPYADIPATHRHGKYHGAAIAVAQAGQVKIEKTLPDVHLDGNVVSCTLTEAETLSLTAGRGIDAKIQLRVGVGGQRMASQVFTVPVERILRDGAL